MRNPGERTYVTKSILGRPRLRSKSSPATAALRLVTDQEKHRLTLAVPIVITNKLSAKPANPNISARDDNNGCSTYYVRGCVQKKCPSPPVVIKWFGSLEWRTSNVKIENEVERHSRLQVSDEVGLFFIPLEQGLRAASRRARRPRRVSVARATCLVQKLPGKNIGRVLVTLDNGAYVRL